MINNKLSKTSEMCVNYQSEKIVIFISIFSLVIGIDVRQISCIFNNERIFSAI